MDLAPVISCPSNNLANFSPAAGNTWPAVSPSSTDLILDMGRYDMRLSQNPKVMFSQVNVEM